MSVFSRWWKQPSRPNRPATQRKAKLEIESLEERMLMNNRFVVSGPADNVTKFTSLQAALSTPGLKAGDVIQIEPGSSPGHIVNADLPMLQNLTIQGDPAADVKTIPYVFLDDFVTIGPAQEGFTLRHLELDILNASVQLNADATITDCRIKDDFAGTALDLDGTAAAVIGDSYIVSSNSASKSNNLVTVEAPSGSHNLITNNQFVAIAGTNIILLYYQTDPAGTKDVVAHNSFLDNTGETPVLEVVNHATGPQMERDDIMGRVGQTGQWSLGTSNGSAFANSVLAAWDPSVTWVDVQTGDFTGDGRTDIIGRALQSGQWWLGVYNGTEFKAILWTTWDPSVTWVDVKVGDFTGDVADIVGRVLQTGQWWVAQTTGVSVVNKLWGSWNPNITWVDVNVGDFTGRRYADIAGRDLKTGQWWVAQSTGAAFINSLWATWNPTVTWVDVQVGDFNGDGLSDVAGRVLQNGQWWVGLSTGTSFNASLWTTWALNVTWVDVKVGDFAGDGKDEIIGRVQQSGQWWLARSNGSSVTNSLWASWNPAVTWVDVQVGDFNGDGKADITGRVVQNGQWWTGLSTGNSFTTTLWASWSPAVDWVDVHRGDFA